MDLEGKKMNRKSKAIMLLAILTLSYTAILPTTAHTEDEPFVTDLLAGQDMDVGDVLVWNDGDYLYVKYVITDPDWTITETHLHVATSLEAIPQKNGNPIPGKFDYNDQWDHVSEVLYEIELTWEYETELYIAVHAVVEKVISEYEIQTETAWGAPEPFPGKNWATYFMYTVQTPPPVIQEYPPGGGNAYIGYEDRTGGDFDYNDFGMNMYVLETYEDGCLSTIEMSFTSLVKKAGDVHDIHLTRFFSADTEYNYEILRSVPAAGTETPAGTYSGSGDLDIILFDSSQGVGKTIEITITVTTCDDYYNPSPVAPRWDVDPFFQNYDPWMYDKSYGPNSWHITNVQPATTTLPTQGYDVPYILIVPYTDWPAPNEAVTITGPYPYFDEWYSTMDSTYAEWYVPGFSP
jgi:hypothetical protein